MRLRRCNKRNNTRNNKRNNNRNNKRYNNRNNKRYNNRNNKRYNKRYNKRDHRLLCNVSQDAHSRHLMKGPYGYVKTTTEPKRTKNVNMSAKMATKQDGNQTKNPFMTCWVYVLFLLVVTKTAL